MSGTELIVWAMFSAILAAVVYAYVMQLCITKLVRKLADKKIHSQDTALTLDDLGYNKKLERTFTAFFAAGNWVLSKAIIKTGGEVTDGTESKDLLFAKKSDVKYYIPEENLTKKIYKHAGERMSVGKLIVLVIILFVFAMLASKVIDFLGNYAYGVITDDGKTSIGVEQKDNSLLSEQEELNKAQQELDEFEKEPEESEQQIGSDEIKQ